MLYNTSSTTVMLHHSTVSSFFIKCMMIVDSYFHNLAITVSFNQSTFNFNEDIGLAQPVLVLSDPSLTDITIKVRDNQNTATSE